MSKIEGDVTTDYLVSGGKILAESNGTDSIYYYYDSNGSIQAMKYGSTIYYYIKSAEGDILGLMNGVTGYVAATYSYDAWGVPTVTNVGNTTIGDINPFRYRGYYYDSETGLYYLGSRYYSPEIGRFISPDSVSYLGANGGFVSYNLFAYCENDPGNRIDCAGSFSFLLAVTIVGGLVGGAVQVVSNVAAGNKWNEDLLGAIVGGATYSFITVLSKGNTAAAAYGAAFAESAVNEIVDYASNKEKLNCANLANSFKKVANDTFVYGCLNYSLGRQVERLIPVNHNWFQPSKIISCFLGKYAIKMTGQTVVQGVATPMGKKFVNSFYIV